MATKKTAAPKTTKAAAPAPEAAETEAAFGVAQVAEIIQVRTGQTVKTRDLRVLLRKMASDGRLTREIIPGNRTPWTFEGPEDPQVEAIVEAFEAGELEADKKEKLDALKAKKTAERAAKKAAAEAEADEAEEVEED